MDDKILKNMGFQYRYEECLGEAPFHYYSLDLGGMTFVSNMSDEARVIGWSVDIIGTNIHFTNANELEDMIRTVRDNDKGKAE